MVRIDKPSWPTTSPELLSALPNAANSAAWQEFDRRYGEVLRLFCRRKGLQAADTDDVTQQVFLEVARNIGSFSYDLDRGRFRSWLVVVTLRAIWKLWQRQDRIREVPFEELQPLLDPSANAWSHDFQEAILELASQQIRTEFSSDEWIVFEQSIRADRPSTEIAESMQRSLSWVYQAKSRILKRLRQQVAVLCEDIATPPHL